MNELEINEILSLTKEYFDKLRILRYSSEEQNINGTLSHITPKQRLSLLEDKIVSKLQRRPMKKQLTLGELIEALEKQDQKKPVKFDFCYFSPDGVHSYRGYYEQLAIGYSYKEADVPTVEEFLKVLTNALDEDFYGYKGGQYKMGKNTPVWVDQPNHASGTAIVGVFDGKYYIVLETASID